jgi:hypothetical protein
MRTGALNELSCELTNQSLAGEKMLTAARGMLITGIAVVAVIFLFVVSIFTLRRAD